MKLQYFGLCLLFVIVEVFSQEENDGIASTGIPKHFHPIEDNESDNQSDSHQHDQNSVFYVLISSFSAPNDSSQAPASVDPNATTSSGTQTSNNDVQFNNVVPEIEMEKLKSAAKNAGLSQAKADRVARAAEAMNMQYSNIVELRQMLNHPATSAQYADKVRRALEDAVVEQELKKNAQISSNEINSKPNQQESVNEPTQPILPSSDPVKQPAIPPAPPVAKPVANNPFDRHYQPGSIFPSPEAFLETFPFPPLPPLFRAFALPPGIFGSNPAEKSPLLELWKASSAVIGQNDAYRLTVVCHNLGLTKEEILELQHLFSDPTITKEKGLQLLSTYENRLSEASKAKLSTPNLDPVTLQSLKSMAKISGLDEPSANRLVRAVMASDLDSDHVMKLANAIQENAPSDTDMKKITSHIETTTKKKAEQQNSINSSSDSEPIVTDGGYEKEWVDNDHLKGAEWIFSSAKGTEDSDDSTSSKNARALNFQGQRNPDDGLRLFVARKFCGFSPIVEQSRLSNTSPGQYPWTAVVLSSRGEFLCGATLLSESIVVCPASCIMKYNQETQNKQPVKVVFGWSMFEGPECHFPQLEIYVSSALVHPLATGSFADVANGENNIALLRLSSNIDFDVYPHIFPVCAIGPSFVQQAGSNNCRVLYWPNLPNMESWRPRTYLTAADVTVSRSPNCGGLGTNYCITGQVCAANAGSPVICLANSQRYYLWGIVKKDNNCDANSITTIPVASAINSYDFISKYLFTSNPNVQSQSQSSPTQNNPTSNSFPSNFQSSPTQNNRMPSSNRQSSPTQTNDVDTW